MRVFEIPKLAMVFTVADDDTVTVSHLWVDETHGVVPMFVWDDIRAAYSQHVYRIEGSDSDD